MARILPRLLPSALAAILAILATAPAAAAGKLAEETVDVPREHRVLLEFAHEKAAIFALESHNDPKADDLEEARQKDPDDKTWVLLRFYYRNEGWTRQRVKVRALLLDEDGGVLADVGRSTKLAKEKTEATFNVPMKVKTLDWGRAAKMKLLVTFLE